eukprot:TRINITY_DN1410_c0_g1_i1.p3 TRINITY_DN1410_c0_g1~~TRINITY_DN1410_c0_g1_i1.p3  ORF type:complete len:108 (-),score=6.99 TRINITY_DN1410_c0_g1_i1:658-981(-)
MPSTSEKIHGCAYSSTKCLLTSISAFLACMCLPQRKNTTPLVFLPIAEITASVKSSQPMPLCEYDLFALAVSTRFSSSTSWFAHFVKSPCSGFGFLNLTFSLFSNAL